MRTTAKGIEKDALVHVRARVARSAFNGRIVGPLSDREGWWWVRNDRNGGEYPVRSHEVRVLREDPMKHHQAKRAARRAK